MQAHRLSAKNGWLWITGGFQIFRRNPSLLGFTVFGYWFFLLILDLLPGIGSFLAALCVPAMSVSVMNTCRAIEEGQRPVLADLLFSGFKRNPRTLLILGAINFLAWHGTLFLTQAIDGGTLMQALRTGEFPEADLLDSTEVQFAMLTTLLLMVPVLMAFWFSPMLVAWENCGAAQAMFFSFIAAWRNGGAFFAYGLGIMWVSGVLPGLFLGLLAAISTRLLGFFAAAMTIPMVLVFVPTLFASFYVSYHQVFAEITDDDETPVADTPDLEKND